MPVATKTCRRAARRERCRPPAASATECRGAREIPARNERATLAARAARRHWPSKSSNRRIQLSAVVKAIKNERNQAENVEVNRARRVPAANENEKSDEKIEQRGRCADSSRSRRICPAARSPGESQTPPPATDLVANLGPRARAKQDAGDVGSAMDLDSREPTRRYRLA